MRDLRQRKLKQNKGRREAGGETKDGGNEIRRDEEVDG
jgi:hypothetical protein